MMKWYELCVKPVIIASIRLCGAVLAVTFILACHSKSVNGNVGGRDSSSESTFLEISWLGALVNPVTGWLTSGNGIGFGYWQIFSDGSLEGSYEIVKDSADNLYVTGRSGRILRYSASTGQFTGWIGTVDYTPTGGASGCTTANRGDTTPGWCLGGLAKNTLLNSPYGIALDSNNYLYVSTSARRILKFNASTGAFIGWIGKIGTSPTGGAVGCAGAAVGTSTPGWCTGGASTTGTGDGMFQSVSSIVVDSSGNLYAMDLNRVMKFNATTGVFLGWMGKIATSPTGGDPGCSGATVGTFTPGWCTGGTATNGTDNAFNNSGSMSIDAAGFLYAANNSDSRIVKVNLNTGTFVGWIGKIGTSPTGGDVGCSGAAVGTFTPGWCTGGTSVLGTGDGPMNAPQSVKVDSSGNLYVADTGNFRTMKYSSSTGAFVGWIGAIATSPTGGAVGCSGAAVGTVTPGWCTGGAASTTSRIDGASYSPRAMYVDSSNNLFVMDWNPRINKFQADTGAYLGSLSSRLTSTAWTTNIHGSTASGNGDRQFYNPAQLAVDGDYLYVADQGNKRINKLNVKTGDFVGWVGAVGSSPTGGAVGCVGAAVASQTPGWCTGGYAQSGTGDGNFSNPWAVAAGNGFVYAGNWRRVLKFDATTGAFVGWIGRIGSSPTGGAVGCSGAAVGTATPGWCTGGSDTSGTGDGMFGFVNGLYVDSNNFLYVADSNGRIQKFDAATGAFLGWIGKIGTSPTGGAAGCSGAAVGTVTPGWCTGGTSSTGLGDGMFGSPYSMAIDGNGHLYVVDQWARVSRFNAATGVFTGWIGMVGTTPTGGDPGCTSAAVDTFSPGWCTGGAAKSVYVEGTGGMKAAESVGLDSNGYLYVLDNWSNAVLKYVAATGAFVGWVGTVKTSPTGGEPGCSGATVFSFTPGWCTGGSSDDGNGNMMSPGGITASFGMAVGSDGAVYVGEYNLNRIARYKYQTVVSK